MKRIFSIVILFIALLAVSTNQAKAQISEGVVMIDPYFGLPSRNAFSEIIWFDYVDQDNFKNVGAPVTFGGRVEYMIIDQLSLGVDVNYASSGFQYNSGYTDPDNGNYLQDALYKYRESNLRAMLRVNFYFLREERFSMYTGLGVGFKSLKRTSTVNGATYGNDIYTPTFFYTSPIAARIAIGGKFYFTDNIGFNFEFGAFGGSILQLGVAVKF